MSNNNVLYKIFGIFSSLYLLAGTYLSGYVALNQEIKFYDVFQAIDEIFLLAFPVFALTTAILIFINYLFNSQKISNNLILILLLFTVFTACFAVSADLPYMLYVYSGLSLAIIALINIFILKEPKESKGVMLIGGSAAYLIAAIITAASYVSTAIYALNPLIGDSLLKFDYSYIIIIVICILAALSFFGEGVYILINAISKRFNKNTYIIMFIWAALNVALKIIIPPQLTGISLYLIYSFFGVIDTWLVDVNWNLFRCFIYMLFVYHSLNFYKKEKLEEIQQIS